MGAFPPRRVEGARKHGLANSLGYVRLFSQQVQDARHQHHEHEEDDARKARLEDQAHVGASPGGGEVLEAVLRQGVLRKARAILARSALRSHGHILRSSGHIGAAEKKKNDGGAGKKKKEGGKKKKKKKKK